MKYILLMLCLFIAACECEEECIARKTGEPIQISDSDGIKIFKKWDGEWIYYSVDASKVESTTQYQYQCGEDGCSSEIIYQIDVCKDDPTAVCVSVGGRQLSRY